MSTLNLPDGRIQLEAWGIAEFLREFQDLYSQGWYVDFEENDGYPVNIGGLVHAKLTKATQDAFVEETEVEVQKESTKATESALEPSESTQVKRGRPAKT
jgi:hypothetical protein